VLDAIKELGEYSIEGDLTKDKFLKNICKKLDDTKYVVFLNFDTKNDKIEIDLEKVNAGGKDSAKKYLWIGNFEGNKPPVNITTDQVSRLLTKTLPEVYKKIEEPLKSKISKILAQFFTIADKNYYIRPKMFNFSDKVMEKLKEIENGLQKKENVNETKKEIKNLIKEVTNSLLSSTELKIDEVAIYTVKMDDELVCETEKYRDMLFYDKIGSLFDEKNKNYKKNLNEKGKCFICREKYTTTNFTNLSFKFYNTDKLGFSFNLDDSYSKNLSVCKNCYQYLMIGEQLIANYANTHIGNIRVYVIPKFISKTSNFDTKDLLDIIIKYSESISNINSATNIKNLRKLQKEFQEYSKYININYMFYKKSKNEFKILKLIKDIPPTRLNYIREKEEDIINLVDDKWDGKGEFKIDLNRIWGCIPLKQKKKGGGYEGISRYLDVIDAIFSKGWIDYNFLINQFIEITKIIKFDRPKYNIPPNQDIVNKIIQLSFLLLFLNKLGVLKNIGGINMNKKNEIEIEDLGIIQEEIHEFWKDTEIYSDEKRKALFLLGYLIGEIGKKQDAKDIKNKPILNKINFQGMGKEKVMRLENEILEKLRQYKILEFNENIFSLSHILLEKNMNNWKLSNQENVFYVLSGYAFSNYIVRKKSKEKYFGELKEKSEYIEKLKEEGKNIGKEEEILEKAKKLSEQNKYSDARKILNKIKIEEVNKNE